MTWNELKDYLRNCDRDDLWTALRYVVLALKGDLDNEK